ncbi:MAG: ABC transporter ATP-binding protein [Bacteroidetes bacterium CG2_30_33_31]|nr:MAG: ABC transporter ATP-binding protein [Bacteroidetes bacterium CG2_30_33_31]
MNLKLKNIKSETLSSSNVHEIILEVNHLKKSFRDQEVLKDISFKLFEGENLVILGKSGSGKSVLVKCIVGLLKSDSGAISIFGKKSSSLNAKEFNELRQKIGFLFQSGALYDSMTVKENLEFPLRRMIKKLTENEISDKVNEVLENVGLKDALYKMPAQLSGGMQKRISLARTIAVDPIIMLYDEPTTGLDPITSDEISTLINEIQKKYKTSSIIITHDIKCALKTANRIIMLKDGEVYYEANVADFVHSDDSFIKSFFN